MIKIDRNLYDNTTAASGFEQLEPGNYCAIILEVKQTQNAWGDDAVMFNFDITDGKFARYFTKDYKAQQGTDKKWRGTLEQSISEKGLPYFKARITAIEESNPGFKWDFEEASLKGKKVGVSFRKEWYEKNGEDKYVVRAFAFRDIAKVISGELEVPKDKPKKGSSVSAAGYTSPTPVPPAVSAYSATAQTVPKFEELTDDDDLPF